MPSALRSHSFFFAIWWFHRSLLPQLFHILTRNSPSVLLTSTTTLPKLNAVATYSHFLGRGVTVQYRVGDILLSASGTFVGDCGRSIFLEQHHQPQQGKRKYFRWEIPYPYIHRIEPEAEATPASSAEPPAATASDSTPRPAAAAAGGDSGSVASSMLPLPPSPDTA
jgi:hypothetical protein